MKILWATFARLVNSERYCMHLGYIREESVKAEVKGTAIRKEDRNNRLLLLRTGRVRTTAVLYYEILLVTQYYYSYCLEWCS